MKNQTTVATGHPGLVRSITLYLPLLLLLLFSACRKNETIERAAPVVISTTPDNHAPALEGPVRLVFNVPMDAASLRQYLVVIN